MSRERAPREEEESPVALHLALFLPFAILVVLSWFTVIAPELATERPPAHGQSDAESGGATTQPTEPADRPAR